MTPGPRDGQLRVRRARPADAEAVAAIGRVSFSTAYSPGSDPADIADHLHRNFRAEVVLAEMAEAGREYWLASVGNTPAGIAKIRSDRPPEGLPAHPGLELQLLYVAPDFQAHGVGSALLDRVVGIAGERGFACVWLSVWEYADWALVFYKRRGFETFSSHTFAVGASTFTDDLMWLPLDKA